MEQTNMVLFNCPECNNDIAIPCHSDNAQLSNFNEGGVPQIIANTIIGNTVYCPHCGDRFTVMGDANAVMVPLFLRKG